MDTFIVNVYNVEIQIIIYTKCLKPGIDHCHVEAVISSGYTFN